MLMPMVQATIFVGVKWIYFVFVFLPKKRWQDAKLANPVWYISNICSDVEATQGGASPVVSLFINHIQP
jgi:hypothetical protein